MRKYLAAAILALVSPGGAFAQGALVGTTLDLSDTTSAAAEVAGGGVWGTSDNRRVRILPQVGDSGTSGSRTLWVNRVRSYEGDDWVGRFVYVQTGTTQSSQIIQPWYFSTSSLKDGGVTVKQGETWNLFSRFETQAPQETRFDGKNVNHVSFYSQMVRSALPTTGVGVPILGAVIESHSQTGSSSATDGIIRVLELDLTANGADDYSPGIGREVIPIVINTPATGGTSPHVTSLIGVYTTTGATFGWGFRPNLTFTQAIIDGRGATQASGAHAIWLQSGQHIALDTAGTAQLLWNSVDIHSTKNMSIGDTTSTDATLRFRAAVSTSRGLIFESGSTRVFESGVDASNNWRVGWYSGGVFQNNAVVVSGATGAVTVQNPATLSANGTALSVTNNAQISGNLTVGAQLLVTASVTPANASAACSTGRMVWDASYVYVCISANTWKRAPIATW